MLSVGALPGTILNLSFNFSGSNTKQCTNLPSTKCLSVLTSLSLNI